MRRTLVLKILLFLPLLGATAQDRVWRYEPAKVELQGRLTIEQKYGPPGYGENPDTDQGVQIPVLLLSAPIDVQGDPQSDLNQETVRGVQRVQLVFGADVQEGHRGDAALVPPIGREGLEQVAVIHVPQADGDDRETTSERLPLERGVDCQRRTAGINDTECRSCSSG